MQTFVVVRLLLLFAHVMAFAVALGCVLREDAKLLSPRPIDAESLQSAARLVRFALIVLWASGTALLVFDTGGVLSRIADNPKMLAKLTVVCVLTANGVALHRLAFAFALAFALLVVRPRVVRKLALGPPRHGPHRSARPGADLPHLQ